MNFRPFLLPRACFALLVVLTGLFATPNSILAQQSYWIWSPRTEAEVSNAKCYFRKKFTLVRPEAGQMFVAAGDKYEIYVNGRIAADGESFGSSTMFDVTTMLQSGVNLISVKVNHLDGAQMGLAMKLRVKEKGETRWRSLVTDSTWRTRVREIEKWKTSSLNDIGWLPANQLQTANWDSNNSLPTATASTTPASTTKPATNQNALNQSNPAKSAFTAPTKPTAATPVATTKETTKQPTAVKAMQASSTKNAAKSPLKQQTKKDADRFTINKEFTVQQVMLENETGSLVAMAFNEFGKMLLSKEGGPLYLADISKPLNDPNRIRVVCDQVNTCQGILPLNGDVYVTAKGPNGLGLYKLTDKDRNGMMEPTQTLLKFTGQLGEHGPHGIQLGGDGMIYVNLGNGSQIDGEVSSTSPYRHTYEGDLVPRYEDPGGHAKGVPAPGGTIVRVSVDGTKIERVAGGIRNSYDMVFDLNGELFIHDSDMESDMGLSWYRPTKIFHVTDGAEMGWRSGWSKYPDYFIDQSPTVADTGRGSPTGAAIYQHIQFPARYHDAMFFADWSEGKILAMRTTPDGASYKAEVETFLTGRPLNVADLAIGEDGALYFCTGGRGTAGGVYRVVWNGKVPADLLKFDSDLEKVIRHPQPNSAWARQNIAKLKQRMGVKKWNQAVMGVADEKRNSVKYRLRAMDKMVLYGPFPGQKSLNAFATDENHEIRAKAAQLCGLKPLPDHAEMLETLMQDKNARVRRIACESMIRLGETASVATLKPMLGSADRVEAMVARRMLERMPMASWANEILNSEDVRVAINGALVMATANPDLETSYKILARCSQLMDGFITDNDFVDLLRVVQVALFQGKVDPAKIPAFANRIGNEFPSGSGLINRELSRIMANLKIGSLDSRIVEYFDSDNDSDADKLHVAMYLQRVGTQLSGAERLAVINYLENAAERAGGSGYKFYVARAIRDVADTMTVDQVKDVLANGDSWPNAVISAFYKMPRELDPEMVELVKQVDQRAAASGNEDGNQIRLGVIAILAQSGQPEAMQYLRDLWQQEPDRRGDISIGLAQQPEGENWAYLISSLPVLDDLTNNEVLEKLATVNRRPRDAAYYRAVIELGFRLRSNGAKKAARLLEHWTGQPESSKAEDWSTVMENWKQWYEATYPQGPAIRLKKQAKQGEYTTDQVLGFLEKNGMGDASHGQQVFTKAQCSLCHRMGNEGSSAGPDLTTLASRFSTREMVDSIIHPSNVVSDQYRSMTVLTTEGQTFTGMATEDSDGSWLVLQSDGKRVRIEHDNVDEIKATDVSSMPTRLLDDLTMPEVADLMAYLNQASHRQAKQSPTADQIR